MTKKIKLVHVTSSLKIGGAEAVLCDLVRVLSKDDSFDQSVVYFHDGPNLENIKNFGVKFYQVKGLICLYDPVFFIRLFVILKKLNPNVVHSLLWSANISSRLAVFVLNLKNRVFNKFIFFDKPKFFYKIKFFVKHERAEFQNKVNLIEHVSAYHNKTCLYSKKQNFLDKITKNLSDVIVGVSQDVAISIDKNFIDNKNSKIIVIKNGLDFDDILNSRVKNKIKREDLGLKESDFVIGFVGRFCPEKNTEFLIRAFARLGSCDKTKLVLVGLGPQEGFLRELVKSLGLEEKVVFVVGKQAYDYFGLFDCFVQPSAKEGLSIALLEAMAFGKLCIVGGQENRHIVIKNGENGIIFYPDFDIIGQKTLVNILDVIIKAKLVGDFDYYKIMAKNGKNTVLNDYSVYNMVDKYREIFRS